MIEGTITNAVSSSLIFHVEPVPAIMALSMWKIYLTARYLPQLRKHSYILAELKADSAARASRKKEVRLGI